jgi:hypothetical protein
VAVTTAPEGVINTYGTLDDLKTRCGITGTSNDMGLWYALHGAARGVDDWCGRHFFVLSAVRLFDVDDPAGFSVPDLVSVTALREDADRDRVYEVLRAPEDYFLYPLNAEPLTAWGRPFTRVVADPEGPLPSFTAGRSTVQVDGGWGYRSFFADSGSDVAGGGVSAAATTVPVTNGAALAPGNTVRAGTEQMFVRQVSANDLTVVRGVNGTTAATQAGGTDVHLFRPPQQVVEATQLLAARYWKRKDSAYGPSAGSNGMGAVRVVPGLDPDIELMLSAFRKLRVGALA